MIKKKGFSEIYLGVGWVVRRWFGNGWWKVVVGFGGEGDGGGRRSWRWRDRGRLHRREIKGRFENWELDWIYGISRKRWRERVLI